MTKNQNDPVGDSKSPALKPTEVSLRNGVDQTINLVAEPAPKLKVQSLGASAAAAARQAVHAPPSTSCQQQIWLSFFFDGTGNNRDADVGTLKHSNVAKLFRAYPENDKNNGIYGVYIPGVGTYFRDVGDDGASKLGLGMGRGGSARLDWAIKQFDENLSRHLKRANSPGNTILNINIALFGFSRGAALARAFSNMLLNDRCVNDSKRGWCLKEGRHRLRIRFMGLFDTVASVGLAMSSNTVSKWALFVNTEWIIRQRLKDGDFAAALPERLAFEKGAGPGADPSPGDYDGHQGWGGKMAIPHMVEEVRHFIAAHEFRNSFPADSVSVFAGGGVQKPEHFHESVFPGAHSDVGGSYRAGEGARSGDVREKLGLVPLHSMYQHAIGHGVPLMPKTAWEDDQKKDFEIGDLLVQRYNYYQNKVGTMSNLGPLINAHMALYFSWRFRSIHRKQRGNHDEATAIKRVDQKFQGEGVRLDAEIGPLEADNDAALRSLAQARQQRASYLDRSYGRPGLPNLTRYDAEVAEAKDRQDDTQDMLLRAKAKRDALPDMSNFSAFVELYDARLIADAESIRDKYSKLGTFFGGIPDEKQKDLRPHYKVMMDAYENEFVHNNGLKDETIIAFFDSYVHDSLSGFAKDATLPSDPRVVYLGGDEKYKYAAVDREAGAGDSQYASTAGDDGGATANSTAAGPETQA